MILPTDFMLRYPSKISAKSWLLLIHIILFFRPPSRSMSRQFEIFQKNPGTKLSHVPSESGYTEQRRQPNFRFCNMKNHLHILLKNLCFFSAGNGSKYMYHRFEQEWYYQFGKQKLVLFLR